MPLVKLGYLFIRTISKPVANILKHQTKSHPAFRSLCVRLAQTYHRTEIRMARRMAQSGQVDAMAPEARIRPLDEQKAIDVGANFLGEAIVFMVAGAVLVVDNSISSRNEKLRRQAIEDKFDQLFSDIEGLQHTIDHLQNKLTDMQTSAKSTDNNKKRFYLF